MIPLIAPLAPLTLTLLLAPPEPPVPTAPRATPVAEDPQEPADATAEDVEVMRRLLVRAVREALGGKDEDASYSVQFTPDAPLNETREIGEADGDTVDYTVRRNLLQRYAVDFAGGARGSVDHSRGFHVPGTGVVYALDVTVPVRTVQPPAEEKEEDAEEAADDAWEAAEREVRGQGGETRDVYRQAQRVYLNTLRLDPRTGVPTKVDLELDSDALDAVVDAALATVARHGQRIEGLGVRDTITVAMHVTGSRMAYPSAFLSADGETVQAATDLAWTYMGLAAGRTLEARVVLQLAVSDLPAVAGLAGKPEELRAHALVHRY